MITYKIKQRHDSIFNAWNLIAVHGAGDERVVMHFLTERQAQEALQRMEAMIAAQHSVC